MTQLTFAMIKSKAIRHNLHPIVLSQIIENGFTIERAHWHVMPKPVIAEFYAEHAGKPYWDDLERSVSGHVIVLALSRKNAVDAWRRLMGATDPRQAKPDTLRTLALGETVMAHNIVHGSDSEANAEREIRLIFGDTIWYHISGQRRTNGT